MRRSRFFDEQIITVIKKNEEKRRVISCATGTASCQRRV